MRQTRVAFSGRLDHIVYFTAGSVLIATAAQYWTTSRALQLESEGLSWILLSSFIKVIRRSRTRIRSPIVLYQHGVKSRTSSCWVVTVTAVVASFCASENNTPYLLLPALTPALLFIERRLNHQRRILQREQSGGWTSLPISMSGSVVISLFGVCTLAYWGSMPSLLGLVLSTIELCALLALYATLLPKPEGVSDVIPFVDIEADITSLTPRITAALLITMALQTVFLGFVPFDPGMMLLASVAKAATWLLAMEIAHHYSWVAVPVIKTFAIFATRSPFIQSFETQALSHVVSSSLVLGQLIALIPKQISNTKLLWLLLAIPALPYLANIHAIRTAHMRAVVFADTHEHPVDTIIQRANANFDNLLLRQSKSYTAACDEYRRRYKFEPPPGFEEWFKYARSHDSKIIDDFDIMYDSIIPLMNYSGREISQSIKNVQHYSDNELWTCKFSGQTRNVDCTHNWRSYDRHVSKLFNQLMGKVNGVLPDVEFLVNHLDEPRVIFPGKQEQSERKLGVNLTDLSHTPTWTSLVQHCDTINIDNTANDKPAIHSFGLPFVQDGRSSKDICKNPSYRDMHGLLMSPTSFRLIQGIVPVLSTGSFSTMGDILFPSPAYTEAEFIYNEKQDPDWARKRNNVYWAGSTSGAFATDSRWKNYHRQRFVSLAQMLDEKEHVYLAAKGGLAQRITSSFLNSRLFDAAFTRIYQCAKKTCREQSFFYRLKGWADKDEALQSRLTFDLDGNGISGRWYKMIASKSAPLKQSIIREWHDDRLLPWVHYIPVSLGMLELPELVMYLTSTERGQQRAREIADRGREWFSQAIRDVDMGVYVYRLLLELARLQDPKRLVSSKANS